MRKSKVININKNIKLLKNYKVNNIKVKESIKIVFYNKECKIQLHNYLSINRQFTNILKLILKHYIFLI